MAIVPLIGDIDNLAEAIANPPANRPIERAIGNFGRQFCDLMSNNPGVFSSPLQAPLKVVCQPYWEDQGYSAPTEEPPFTGGQCAITYVFGSLGSEVCPTGPTDVTAFVSGPGPISGVTSSTVDTGLFPRPLLTTFVVSFADDVRNLPVRHDIGIVPCTRVFPADPAIPDNCGDPPGVPAPGPNPAPNPGPLPPGTGPTINIRGQPIIVLPPTLEIAPDITIDLPDGNYDFGGGGSSGNPQEPFPSDEQPGGGSGAGGGDSDFGDPPDGERWAGCCVTITTAPVSAGSIPQAEPESIYPRTIGNVRLRFRSGSSAIAHDTPLVNRQKTTCVWEPVRGMQPVGVRVNLLPGYQYTFTPYSVPEDN